MSFNQQICRGNGQEREETELHSMEGGVFKRAFELSPTTKVHKYPEHHINDNISGNSDGDIQQETHAPNERLSPDKLRSIQSQPNTFIIDLQQQQQLQQQQK